MSLGLFPIAGQSIAGFPSGAAPPPPSAQTLIEGLRSFLAASSTVTALTTSANLFPAQGQQGTPSPRVVYKRESEEDDDTLDRGRTKSPTAQLKLECYGGRWGAGYKSARQLADGVLNADGGIGGGTLTSGFRGFMGLVFVQSARCTNDDDQQSAAVDGSGRAEQWVELSLSVAYLKQV